MATRAEQYKAAQERHGHEGSGVRKERSKPGVPPAARSHDKKHAQKKATYALEQTTNGRPSRKSTRKAANRAKPDSNFNLREEMQKASPTNRFRKAHARAMGSRRSPAPAAR